LKEQKCGKSVLCDGENESYFHRSFYDIILSRIFLDKAKAQAYR
jgi:hypothetical protein